jgi:hypothetical protein
MTTKTVSAGWTPGPAAGTRQRLPQFELLRLCAHGAVFRSHDPCEPGTLFVFGIHLPGARRHRLMDLEAVVVDSRPAAGRSGLGWEVTFIFEGVTPAQVSVLRRAAAMPLEQGPLAADGSLLSGHPLCAPGLN